MTVPFDPHPLEIKISCQSNQPDLVCHTGECYSKVLLAGNIFTLFFTLVRTLYTVVKPLAASLNL